MSSQLPSGCPLPPPPTPPTPPGARTSAPMFAPLSSQMRLGPISSNSTPGAPDRTSSQLVGAIWRYPAAAVFISTPLFRASPRRCSSPFFPFTSGGRSAASPFTPSGWIRFRILIWNSKQFRMGRPPRPRPPLSFSPSALVIVCDFRDFLVAYSAAMGGRGAHRSF